MVSLKTLQARLSRKVPDSHKHMTVYGTQELTTFTCVVCMQKGYLSEAYLESKTKRKHNSHVRPFHASCYLETNGKVPRKKEPSATLLNFIMEQL
jgi:hypothetical protein